MISVERRFAEESALVLASMGMPPAFGKLMGWLLICDPPEQTSSQLAEALGMSKGSVSAGMRMLENTGLVRRVARPGERGKFFVMTVDAMTRAVEQGDQYREFRELADRGLALLGEESGPRAQRLRRTRDFYLFIERELPQLMTRFKAEFGEDSDG